MIPPYPTTSLPIRATKYARLRNSLISERKRFGLQGRGYTLRSMAMMPFRWRRRILAISSSTGSSTLIPGDLRIRLPHVERTNIVEPVVLLPLEARYGELDQFGRGREGLRRGRELHMIPDLLELVPKGERSIAHQQDILRARFELRRQARRGANLEVGLACHAARDRSVER